MRIQSHVRRHLANKRVKELKQHLALQEDQEESQELRRLLITEEVLRLPDEVLLALALHHSRVAMHTTPLQDFVEHGNQRRIFFGPH